MRRSVDCVSCSGNVNVVPLNRDPLQLSERDTGCSLMAVDLHGSSRVVAGGSPPLHHCSRRDLGEHGLHCDILLQKILYQHIPQVQFVERRSLHPRHDDCSV